MESMTFNSCGRANHTGVKNTLTSFGHVLAKTKMSDVACRE
jgi:hypothetical protein